MAARRRRKQKLVLGQDYYYENGKCILTREYLLSRGECCYNNCVHCPYPEGCAGKVTERASGALVALTVSASS